MLKITTETSGDEIRLKLEGDIAGPWVQDLEECWRDAVASHAGAPTCLELTGVGHVDDAGRYLLALIAKAGTRLVAAGVAMKDLLDSILADWPSPQPVGPGSSAAAALRTHRRRP